jgi:DNA-binding NarL/FixJ family response regulator
VKRRTLIKGAAASVALLAISGPVMSAVQQPRDAVWLPRVDRKPTQTWFYPLTPRQAQVSELVAAGLSTKEIAKTFWISENTTAHHIYSILMKLDFHRRSQIGDWVATHRPPGDLLRTAVTFPYGPGVTFAPK